MMTDAARSELDDFLDVPPPSPWHRRIVWIAAGVCFLLLAFLLARCVSGPGGAAYLTEDVRRGDLRVTVSATGKLAPTNQVEVGSEVSGTIEKVLVDFNDRVHRGQPLAIIDTDLLDDQIAQARAALEARRASVADAQAALAVASASLERLRAVERLSGGKVPARTEMEQAIAAHDRAMAAVRLARANVVAGEAELSSNMTRRSKAVIIAPVTGVVLSRKIEPGQTVAASFNTPTLFIIAEDLRAMQLEVAIDEADVGQVRAGQSARFTVDAWPGESFPARIERVNLGANNLSSATASSAASGGASAASGASVVAYDAILSVDNPTEKLRPGMTATADIAVRSVRDVLLVPNSAFRFVPGNGKSGAQQGGGLMTGMAIRPRMRRQGSEQQREIGAGSHQRVYVLDEGGKPKAIEVVTGASDGRVTAVASRALRPGMRVITGQKAERD